MSIDYKEEIEAFDELSDIFKKLIGVFNPYFACITSRSVVRIFGKYYDNKNDYPVSIFDINYWGKDAVEKLPIHKIKEKVFECTELNNGYYIRLQKEPINISNAEHMQLQKEINDLLGI